MILEIFGRENFPQNAKREIIKHLEFQLYMYREYFDHVFVGVNGRDQRNKFLLFFQFFFFFFWFFFCSSCFSVFFFSFCCWCCCLNSIWNMLKASWNSNACGAFNSQFIYSFTSTVVYSITLVGIEYNNGNENWEEEEEGTYTKCMGVCMYACFVFGYRFLFFLLLFFEIHISLYHTFTLLLENIMDDWNQRNLDNCILIFEKKNAKYML